MAYLEIPLDADLLKYQERVTLEGTTYIFDFYYNGRDGKWRFDISTSAEEPIVTGVPLYVNTDMLGSYIDARLPAGRIVLIDLSGLEADPTSENMKDYRLIYKESTT